MQAATERFWAQDPAALFRPDRLAYILPQPGAPLAEQLNAAMRFALYYGAIVLVIRQSCSALYLPLVAAAVTVLIYRSDARHQADVSERMQALELEKDRATGEMRVSPTRDNPFMNVLVSDVGRFPNRPPAADLSDEGVLDRVERDFAHNLYRDQGDIFNRSASSRQFYTMPTTTIPNDQAGFARWLYRTGPTCKEGKGGECYRRAYRPLMHA